MTLQGGRRRSNASDGRPAGRTRSGPVTVRAENAIVQFAGCTARSSTDTTTGIVVLLEV
jgi:hypothetical protein